MAAPRTRVRLRVSPGSRTAGIAGPHGDAWKVRVTAPAADGRANAAVVRLLAETFGLSRSSVSVVSGRGTREKLVELTGIDPDETERRLAAAGKDAR
ncbi:MAG: DUF167 family protein [Actinomycetota bacterium]|nr:DUF167 family protein [Actinomycetota bacterium]